MSAGSWEKSASISSMRSAPPSSARPNPARYAGPIPSFRRLCRTSTSSRSRASRSAISPVPSGELSSTIRSRYSGAQVAREPVAASTIGTRFSASLYVGRTSQAPDMAAYPRPRHEERRGSSPFRRAGGPLPARWGRLLPGDRLPQRGQVDTRGERIGGGDDEGRQGDRARRRGQDDRREAAGAVRDRRDPRGSEAEGQVPAGARRDHA